MIGRGSGYIDLYIPIFINYSHISVQGKTKNNIAIHVLHLWIVHMKDHLAKTCSPSPPNVTVIKLYRGSMGSERTVFTILLMMTSAS